MPKLEVLETHLASLGRVILGYSGGVDSAFLAVVAAKALGKERFLAVIGRSPSYPAGQYATALEVATRFNLPLLEVETHELEDPRYTANPVNRCYFCKTELWSVLGRIAREQGFTTVVDGTNADDLGDHRPGLKAADESAVRSPLAELGWTKAEIREAARGLGIPVWDAPASPCLSSRIQYGLAVTPRRLCEVEAGETYLRSLGIEGNLRVRHHGDRVRIEADPAAQPTLAVHQEAIERFFHTLGIHAVEVDSRGYRRGSLLNVIPTSA
jgi:pyridinium-3,5-biscarboxylic acid mononucleotide sulfurtransferase